MRIALARSIAGIGEPCCALSLSLAKRALVVSPGDADTLIDAVNLLDETGHHAEADELYHSTAPLYRQLAERYQRRLV